jgi:hypothetical protein
MYQPEPGASHHLIGGDGQVHLQHQHEPRTPPGTLLLYLNEIIPYEYDILIFRSNKEPYTICIMRVIKKYCL